MTATISIFLKSFEPLEESKSQQQAVASSQFTEVFSSSKVEDKASRKEEGPLSRIRKDLGVGLPTKRIVYTLIRSPHIDKKAREQFEMKIYKKLIRIRTKHNQLYEKLSNCKLHDLHGVQMKITFSYKTRWSNYNL